MPVVSSYPQLATGDTRNFNWIAMEIICKEAKTSDIHLFIPLVKAFYTLEKIAFDEKTVEAALEQLLTINTGVPGSFMRRNT